MTGWFISFNGSQSEISLTSTVSGFTASAQNALVCIGTIAGTDKAYPDKGTKLLIGGLQGAMINLQTATHQANFAAIDTLFFVNEVEPAGSPERIQSITLQPVTRTSDGLKIKSQFVSSLGTTLGVLATL